MVFMAEEVCRAGGHSEERGLGVLPILSEGYSRGNVCTESARIVSVLCALTGKPGVEEHLR